MVRIATGLLMFVIGLGLPWDTAQAAAPQAPQAVHTLYVYDATGKRVAPIVMSAFGEFPPMVAFRFNRIVAPVTVERTRFVALGGLYFEAPECGGQPYMVSMQWRLPGAAIAPPNQTLYAPDAAASPRRIVYASAWGQNRGCSNSQGEVEDAVPALPVIDLEGSFTPPFSVR